MRVSCVNSTSSTDTQRTNFNKRYHLVQLNSAAGVNLRAASPTNITQPVTEYHIQLSLNSAPISTAGVNLRGFANPGHPHFYGQQNDQHWFPPGRAESCGSWLFFFVVYGSFSWEFFGGVFIAALLPFLFELKIWIVPGVAVSAFFFHGYCGA